MVGLLLVLQTTPLAENEVPTAFEMSPPPEADDEVISVMVSVVSLGELETSSGSGVESVSQLRKKNEIARAEVISQRDFLIFIYVPPLFAALKETQKN